MNFYDMIEAVWKPGKYEIIIRGKKKVLVEGEIWGVWGVHYEKNEKAYRLTYIPNGRMVAIEDEKMKTQFVPNCDGDQLKELASILNPYLKDGKIPSHEAPIKKVLRDFINCSSNHDQCAEE